MVAQQKHSSVSGCCCSLLCSRRHSDRFKRPSIDRTPANDTDRASITRLHRWWRCCCAANFFLLFLVNSFCFYASALPLFACLVAQLCWEASMTSYQSDRTDSYLLFFHYFFCWFPIILFLLFLLLVIIQRIFVVVVVHFLLRFINSMLYYVDASSVATAKGLCIDSTALLAQLHALLVGVQRGGH